MRSRNGRLGGRSLLRVSTTLFWLSLLGCDQAAYRSPEFPGSEHQLVGTPAPPFELPAQNGAGVLSLEQYTGKPVLVDFWATWCVPCKKSFPFYQSLTDEYADRLAVLAISVDEDPDKIADFIDDLGVTFPVGWDEGQVVSRLYQPETMPTSYLIDQHGVVQHVHAGFKSGDSERLTRELEQLLK